MDRAAPGCIACLPVRPRPRVVVLSSALDAMLEAGTLAPRQHAAALAYAAFRRRYDRSGGPMRSWRDR
jgi:hypothetical protein